VRRTSIECSKTRDKPPGTVAEKPWRPSPTPFATTAVVVNRETQAPLGFGLILRPALDEVASGEIQVAAPRALE
jgi:hypothetical protein